MSAGQTDAPRERPDAWLARRGGVVELLRVPAVALRSIVGARNWLYDRGLLPSARLDAPVISVGNLTVGGTGKTPMVVWLARELEARGRRAGLLSRGYRARRGGGELNDEGRLLAELLPGVPHIQNPDRIEGGRELVARGVDVVVLDDGFQHRRLRRDLDLVLVDATRPWGLPPVHEGEDPVRALLPRGLLREKVSSLARAHAVVLTRADAVRAADLDGLEALLEREVPGTPRMLAEHRPSALLRVAAEGGGVFRGDALRGDALRSDSSQGAERLALADLRDRAVVLVSGIGNPEAFEASARALGAEVRGVYAFPDHHEYSQRELAPLVARGRELLVTAKDSVKLAALGVAHLVLEVELVITRGESVLAALIDALPPSGEERRRGALHEGLHG